MRDTTINQGSTLTFSYSATDPDAGTTISYSLLSGPSGASINSSGAFTFTPPANPARTYSIVAIASDGTLADTAKATVTVNRKPSIVSKSPATLTILSQNKSTVFSVSTVNPDGGALTFQWKVNGVVDKSGPDSTYTKSFADPNATAKTVVCVASNSVGLKDSVTWSFTITDVEKNEGAVPTEFALGQNYPNPFNPSTTIRFDLPKEAPVTLEIYNVLGVRVRSLLAGEAVNAGTHSMVWDGRDDNGITMPSGVYLYRISAGDFQASRKMTMIK
jgi:flagellar hook assembly protein FlgD